MDLSATMQAMALASSSGASTLPAELNEEGNLSPLPKASRDDQRPPAGPVLSFGTALPASSASEAIGASSASETNGASGPNVIGDSIVELPRADFTFGTCSSAPSVPLSSTPTAEKGEFEYPPLFPSHSPFSTSRPAPQTFLELGNTHRRNSIIAVPGRKPSINPMTDSTRRSSTCSTITTLPIGGRRPSILHSASTTTPIPPFGPLGSPMPATGRRGSLMFQPKVLPARIPPSLARRGSVPAAELFGLPSTDRETGRKSVSALPSNGSAMGMHTTSVQLYARRESLISEGGESSSSSQTISGTERIQNERGEPSPSSRYRSSLSEDPSFRSSSSDTPSFQSSSLTARRSSLPFLSLPAGLSAQPSPVRPIRPSSTSQAHSRFLERRARPSSASTRGSSVAGTSLESSEESNEEEEEPVVTPLPAGLGGGYAGSGMTFSDPWAKSERHLEKGDEVRTMTMKRPVLETIPSDRMEMEG